MSSKGQDQGHEAVETLRWFRGRKRNRSSAPYFLWQTGQKTNAEESEIILLVASFLVLSIR